MVDNETDIHYLVKLDYLLDKKIKHPPEDFKYKKY